MLARDLLKKRASSRQRALLATASARTKSRKMSSLTARSKAVGGWASPSSGPEKKFIDVSSPSTPSTALPTFSSGVLLNGLATGTSASDRIGRKIIMKSIFLRYAYQLQSTTTGGSPLRILVVYDKQANGAAPAITDILLTDNFSSNNNLSNRDRFVTLMDHMTDVVSVGNNYSVQGTVSRALNLETVYNDLLTNGITAIASGSIYCFIAQTGGALTAAPALTGRFRIRYTDA